jgi:hypothetical protein
MSTRSFALYRGCRVEVHVTPVKSQVLGGACRRYRVSWTISAPRNPRREVDSLPNQFDFLSEIDAFRYGESGAHAYIDSVLSTPSCRRKVGGNSEQEGEAPTV